MSKSYENENAYITLLEEPSRIMNKVKRAVTDSENQVRYDIKNKPGISNLIDIYASITGKSIEDIEREFSSAGYGQFKNAVGEAIVETLSPIQERFKELSKEKGYINNLIREGAEKAERMSYKTLNKVMRKIGLYQVK